MAHSHISLTTISWYERAVTQKSIPIPVKIRTVLREHQRIWMKYTSGSGTRVQELDPYGLEMHQGIQYLVGYDYFRNEVRVFRPTQVNRSKLEIYAGSSYAVVGRFFPHIFHRLHLLYDGANGEVIGLVDDDQQATVAAPTTDDVSQLTIQTDSRQDYDCDIAYAEIRSL